MFHPCPEPWSVFFTASTMNAVDQYINFLKTEVNKEKGNCELLSVLAKDHLKLLTENRNYDYIVLTQPKRVSDYII